jgi:hypothetical protein
MFRRLSHKVFALTLMNYMSASSGEKSTARRRMVVRRGAIGMLMMAASAFSGYAQQKDLAAGNSSKGLVAEWARTFASTDGTARLNAVAADASGNVYAAGWAKGSSDYSLSADVHMKGVASGSNYNVLLVKYDAAGKAKWARTLTSGVNGALYSGVAVDRTANVYAAGSVAGNAAFGDGVSATGGAKGSALIVKYSSAGTALWARSTISNDAAVYSHITVDPADNIYAVGSLEGKSTCDFGNNVTLTGLGGPCALLVKYDSSGAPQWARTLAAGKGAVFNAVAVDLKGNILAAGSIGSDPVDFGNGVNVAGDSKGNRNVLLVMYDVAGRTIWARSLTEGSDDASYSGIAVDGAGDAYAAGMCNGSGTYGFGNGVSAAGSAIAIQGAVLPNVLLVKYDNAGEAQWARTLVNGDFAQFSGAAADHAGNVYSSGLVAAGGGYYFGNGTKTTPSFVNTSALLVKYSAAGAPSAADSATSTDRSFSARDSRYLDVAVDNRGSIYAVGTVEDGSYAFGDGVTLNGTGGHGLEQILLVKYRDPGVTEIAFSPTTGVLNDSRVRLRSSPNLQASTLQFLSKGENVSVIARSAAKQQIGDLNDYWYQVRTPEGGEGWTYGAFIDFPANSSQ